MTEAGSDPAERATAPKAVPPGLDLRAPRPSAVRLRRSVVQAILLGGAVLVSGALAWAFVVQPALREDVRARRAEARETAVRGPVRPTEAVTDQPATYDRLPPPRGTRAGPEATPADRSIGRPSGAGRDAPSDSPSRVERPSGPTPGQLAVRSALFFEDGGADAARPGGRPGAGQADGRAATARRDPDVGVTYNDHHLVAPVSPFELKAGAIVPAALLTAVDTARAGPVVATVTQNVYDTVSGRHLLVPQGARLIGATDGKSAYGDRRAFLTWERLILPNGKSLILSSEAGVDAQGAIGVRGEADRRLWPLLVGTLFAGAVTTLGQVARDGDDDHRGLLGDAGDAAAIVGAQVGGRLIDRELAVAPSIRLTAGAPVRVLITRDLVLEPYRR